MYINKKRKDDIIWLKIDKSLLNLTYVLYLCLCYVIPTGSSREALTEISVLDRISDYIVEISNATENCYHVLVCWDLNSRTGAENDFVILDNLNNDMLPEDYVTDDFMARFSEDKSINSNGELGSNYLLTSRDFKICMVIRAIYFKVCALANR